LHSAPGSDIGADQHGDGTAIVRREVELGGEIFRAELVLAALAADNGDVAVGPQLGEVLDELRHLVGIKAELHQARRLVGPDRVLVLAGALEDRTSAPRPACEWSGRTSLILSGVEMVNLAAEIGGQEHPRPLEIARGNADLRRNHAGLHGHQRGAVAQVGILDGT